MLLFPLVYFGLYCYFVLTAFAKLKQKSNTEFKIANQIVRLQVSICTYLSIDVSLYLSSNLWSDIAA